MKFYKHLTGAKSTVRTIEEFKKQELKELALKQRISTFEQINQSKKDKKTKSSVDKPRSSTQLQ